MDAFSDATFRDRAVFLDGTLVLADLHVGQGVTSNVEFPVGDGADMVDRFEALCDHFEPEEVVVAGDLLYSFDGVPRLAESTLGGLQSAADAAGVRIVVTPGNHDTMLDTVWSGPTTPDYRLDGTVVCHGHVEPTEDATRYVIGHDHPTITIEGQRRPCYLVGEGTYEGSDVLMLPSFNRLVSGVEVNDMRSREFMSPLLRDIGSMAPHVLDPEAGEALAFPPLGEFRGQL
jgi:putative SbcD/Mre11-related phosphoesterase